MNLQDHVSDAIDTDDEYSGKKDDKRIIDNYNSLCATDKEKVDDIFISLTGFSLKTLISKL